MTAANIGYWYDFETGGVIMGDVRTGEVLAWEREPAWPLEDALVNAALNALDNNDEELGAYLLELAPVFAWACGR